MTTGTTRQLDLFAGGGAAPPHDPDAIGWAPIDPARLADRELLAAIPRAGQAEASGLAREAVRRGLREAVPALDALCRRFAGFGLDREVAEQGAALAALADLGGKDAAEAVTRLIVRDAVRGPGCRHALEAAARLRCRLPADRIAGFLRDDNPAIREAACGCAQGNAAVIGALIELLSDLHPAVTVAAALALGRLGRREGVGILLRLLRSDPSPEIIAALAPIAEDDELVRLGQTAMAHPDLAPLVLDVLDDSEVARAAVIAAGLRRRVGGV